VHPYQPIPHSGTLGVALLSPKTALVRCKLWFRRRLNSLRYPITLILLAVPRLRDREPQLCGVGLATHESVLLPDVADLAKHLHQAVVGRRVLRDGLESRQ
jgi:hypothetical protein